MAVPIMAVPAMVVATMAAIPTESLDIEHPPRIAIASPATTNFRRNIYCAERVDSKA
jgi:hypothetical protein